MAVKTTSSSSSFFRSFENLDPLPLYLFAASLLFFHASEFALAFHFQRQTLSTRSLLFSRPYVFAMLCAVAEYFAESALVDRARWRFLSFLPRRLARFVTFFGLIVVISGEILRKTAMITAARAFTHDLARTKKKEHELVDRGVYRWMRHPSYVGFFLYAVGTQIVLRNPVCSVAFAVVVSRFMAARVEAEEALLVSFFGAQYLRYSSRVRRWGVF